MEATIKILCLYVESSLHCLQAPCKSARAPHLMAASLGISILFRSISDVASQLVPGAERTGLSPPLLDMPDSFCFERVSCQSSASQQAGALQRNISLSILCVLLPAAQHSSRKKQGLQTQLSGTLMLDLFQCSFSSAFTPLSLKVSATKQSVLLFASHC